MNIEGTTALITGCSRGIGRDLVLALVKSGAKKVYATARNISDIDAPREIAPWARGDTEAGRHGRRINSPGR